jgi:hypothetical protein
MMTAKEFWLNKFPDLEKDWGKTGHDDNFQVRMMEEYAKYYHEQVKKCDLADVGGNEVALKLKGFAEKQQDIPDDIQSIINDNFWDLL